MKIIDAHNHLWDEPNYVDHLLRAMDASGVQKCAVSGLGEMFGFADDHAVKQALDAHPDRIIGAVFVRPGVDGPEKIDWGYDHGFRIVKVTIPTVGYEDPSLFPLWQRALDRNMPVLFHTGTVATRDYPGQGISSWNMHPMRIEPITREFPDLDIIIAHLGVHWNRDAAVLARMRPNVYVDLTGEPGGWRDRPDTTGVNIKNYLWWDGAFDKVVFGADVHYSKVARIISEDCDRMNALGLDGETQRRVLSGNIEKLLGRGE